MKTVYQNAHTRLEILLEGRAGELAQQFKYLLVFQKTLVQFPVAT